MLFHNINVYESTKCNLTSFLTVHKMIHPSTTFRQDGRPKIENVDILLYKYNWPCTGTCRRTERENDDKS